jgi:hypothetical protein
MRNLPFPGGTRPDYLLDADRLVVSLVVRRIWKRMIATYTISGALYHI